ncbi:NfeD family protein [Oscillatoria sp. FACHB-1406]|uniref:NfeD family protein n=1 Tax=Oscillatoria sp. FACHB-1406 TaxID=2692846 RepID=UPI001681EE95|nr:NfeD family protein [Oscillatoria sp. FACHB-1406]MBD2580182.1 NfeD family protein [Oscillatoria sp. FACHB-1406]
MLYTLCALIGGAFVLLAAVGGIDGPDFDFDFDTDLDFPPHSPTEESLFDRPRPRKPFWLPFFSLKFWTFGVCFFGLTGIVLSRIPSNLSPVAIAAISAIMGIFLGTFVALVLQHLRRHQANSLIRPNDLIGLPGVVEIPVARDRKGKIRVSVKGSNLDLIALTESDRNFERGEKVYIVGSENHKVWVVEPEILESNP